MRRIDRSTAIIDRIDHFVPTARSLDGARHLHAGASGVRRKLEPGKPAALPFGAQKIDVQAIDRSVQPRVPAPPPGAGNIRLVAADPVR